MGHRESKVIDRAVRQEAAHAELIARRADHRRESLRLARLFHTVAGSFHYVYEGCSSIGAYGERHGFSAREARVLVEVGRALEAYPEVEDRVLAGRISLDAAAVLGRFSENAEELAREGESWLDHAERWTARRLEREYRKRLRESETGGPVSVLEAILTSKGREKFERARRLACKKRNEVLDEGRTVEVLSDHYLDSFDPSRKVPRRRRMPDTGGRSGRHVPAAVRREVLSRTGGRCANPECDHEIFVDLSHDRPHARGGSRESANLDPLCRGCHALRDRGLLAVRRTPAGLEFRTREGRLIGATPGARAPPP